MSIANLFVPNGLTLYAGYLTLEDNLLVDGNATVDGNLLVGGNATVDGNLTVNGTFTQKSYYRVDYNNTGVTFLSGVTAAMPFTSNQASSNFTGPTSSNTIYNVPIAGLYEISYTISFSNLSITGIGIINSAISTSTSLGSVASSVIPIFATSSLVVGPPVSAITLLGPNYQLTGSTIIYLIPTNNISLVVYQTSGGSMVTSTSNTSMISINFLHA
jgi:hypothetical protein